MGKHSGDFQQRTKIGLLTETPASTHRARACAGGLVHARVDASDLDLLSPRVREPALELFKSKKAVAIRIERGECLNIRIER